jgi:hypothetical protein
MELGSQIVSLHRYKCFCPRGTSSQEESWAPLIHFLRQANGLLFIPDILRQEYLEQTVAVVTDQRNQISIGYDRVLTLVGRHDDFQVPSDKDVSASVTARLGELETLTLGQALTDEMLADAGKRVIAKRPPCFK